MTVDIPLTADIVAEAIGSVLAGRKPSKGPGRGLLDPVSMIAASIASFAREQDLSEQDAVLICSDNHRDFGLWDPDSGKHVIAPDIAAALPCPVRYYKSPRMLVEEELQVVVEADKPLAQALHQYDEFAKTMASLCAAGSLAGLLKLNMPVFGADALKGMSAGLLKGMDASSLAGLNAGLLKGLDTSYLTGFNAGLFKGLSSYIEDFEPEDEVEEQDGLANDEPNDEADDHAEED